MIKTKETSDMVIEATSAKDAPVEKRISRDSDPHAPAGRPARVRTYESRGSLSFPSIPGYHTRLVTVDDPGDPDRYEKRLSEWYEPVTRGRIYGPQVSNPDEIVTANVGSKNSKVLHGKLMMIPLEYIQEDLNEKDKIRRAKVAQSNRDAVVESEKFNK